MPAVEGEHSRQARVASDDRPVEIDDAEDVQPIRHAPDPKLPSADEVEEHRCMHIPYRDWCKWCVMGRGRGLQHSRALASFVAIVGLDYFFITRGGLWMRKELSDDYPRTAEGEAKLDEDRATGDIVKCLIVRCLQTKVLFAHVVPYKGASEDRFVAQLVVADIEWIGHTKLIIKSDNEPALQTLVVQSLERARLQCDGIDTISQEHPAKYDSQSNGGVEVGVMLIRGLFRTHKLCFESRIGKFVPIDHAVIPWMLEHTSLVLNARQKGPDGLTAWARCRGRAFNQRLLGFGENVLYKLPMKGPQAAPDGNMGAKWADAVFLGYHRNSNSYIVHHSTGIATSRSLSRKPDKERWCADTVAKLQSTPWSLHERPEPEVRFHEPASGTHSGAEPATAAPPALRRMRINKADLDKYGYTVDCPQCRHTEEHGHARSGSVHTDACRQRIMAELSKDPVGQQRIATYDERLTRSMAEHVERSDARTHGQARVASDHRNELGMPMPLSQPSRADALGGA